MDELFEKKIIRFDEIKNYDKTRDTELMNTLELIFYDLKDKKGNSIDPIAKQSSKHMIYRHKKPKTFDKAYKGAVNSGDVILFLNKRTGTRDVFDKFYQPAKIVDYEKNLKLRTMEQLPIGFKPFEKIVIVEEMIFGFKFLSSHPKKLKEAYNSGVIKLKTTAPDMAENLNKAVWDALEGTIFKNDSLIASIEKMAKIYAPTSFIYLKLRGI